MIGLGDTLFPSPEDYLNVTRRTRDVSVSLSAVMPLGIYWKDFQTSATAFNKERHLHSLDQTLMRWVQPIDRELHTKDTTPQNASDLLSSSTEEASIKPPTNFPTQTLQKKTHEQKTNGKHRLAKRPHKPTQEKEEPVLHSPYSNPANRI